MDTFLHYLKECLHAGWHAAETQFAAAETFFSIIATALFAIELSLKQKQWQNRWKAWREHKWQKARERLMIVALVLAVCTFLGMTFIVGPFDLYEKAEAKAAAAVASAENSDRQRAIALQKDRARFQIDQLEIQSEVTANDIIWYFKPQITNIGATAALDAESVFCIYSMPPDSQSRPQVQTTTSLGHSYGATKVIHYNQASISGSKLASLFTNGASRLFVTVGVSYRTIYDRAPKHFDQESFEVVLHSGNVADPKIGASATIGVDFLKRAAGR